MNILTDTTPEADAVLLELLRRTPVWRKLQLVSQLNDLARAMAVGSLRRQYPHAGADELQRLLAERILGAELANTVYGPKPKRKTTD